LQLPPGFLKRPKMKITQKGLKTLQSIEFYLFFSMKIDEVKTIKSLASESTRDALVAYLKYFIRGNRGFLGGFQIRFVDEQCTEIKKVVHSFIDRKKEDGDFVIDVERYTINKTSGLPNTGINDFKEALKYGNT
jgi:hypothetical protein